MFAVVALLWLSCHNGTPPTTLGMPLVYDAYLLTWVRLSAIVAGCVRQWRDDSGNWHPMRTTDQACLPRPRRYG